MVQIFFGGTMKFKAFVSIFLLCLMLFPKSLYCIAEEDTSKPQLLSEAFVLMEASTGTVIYEKNMNKVLPPASITKIMTLILIYEALDEGVITKETIVTASDYAASMGGSQVYLEAGEQQTVETLIKCICISSANDACVTMAEHLCGTESAFVEEMNQKAKELGMKDTHFVNCCGLDIDGHVSSAYDIALMSKELMTKHPDIVNYSTKWMDTMTHTTKNGSTEFGLTNTNKLLRQYDGITGLKTGSTSKARYCLSATATRNDIDMIAVVLSAPDTKTRFKEAATLLNYGFSQCKIYSDEHEDLEPIKVLVEQSLSKEVELEPKHSFQYVSVAKEDFSNIQKECYVYDTIVAPIEKGEELGTIVYSLDGKELGRVSLIAKENVERATYIDYLNQILHLLT